LFIIGLFFPFLWLPLLVFAGMFLLFIPFKFTIDSIFNLFTVPRQLYKIATNPLLRKNHGLEHATVNILEREHGFSGLAGYAVDEGFYIMGVDNAYLVEEAARKGASLLKRGNNELVIHKRCGTSMTVANLLSSVIFLGLLIYTGYFSILNMILAIIIANLLGPLLGQLVQKKFTTTPEVEDMEIVSAHYETGGQWNQPFKVFVRTQSIPYLNK
ncbi:MAG: DUF6391 domain-containing protein, partial [Bacillota bacterium]